MEYAIPPPLCVCLSIQSKYFLTLDFGSRYSRTGEENPRDRHRMLGGGKFPLLYPFHRQGEHTFVYEAGNEVLLVHHHHSVLGRWSSPPLRWRNTTPGTSNCTDTYSQLTSTQTHNLKCTQTGTDFTLEKVKLVFVQLKISQRIATMKKPTSADTFM